MINTIIMIFIVNIVLLAFMQVGNRCSIHRILPSMIRGGSARISCWCCSWSFWQHFIHIPSTDSYGCSKRYPSLHISNRPSVHFLLVWLDLYCTIFSVANNKPLQCCHLVTALSKVRFQMEPQFQPVYFWLLRLEKSWQRAWPLEAAAPAAYSDHPWLSVVAAAEHLGFSCTSFGPVSFRNQQASSS